MQNLLATLTGKLVRLGLFFRSGGGHALPGLVIEKFFPNYVPSMLQKLPEGVVVITGTNGKTTTTKIVTHILKSSGKRVITNSTGSNLVRGIASSLAQHASLTARLDYDIAVLEVDEATARRLVQKVKPKWVLALNVSRDQLDRFGEVDTVASYVKAAMEQSGAVVTNGSDPHLLKISQEIASSNKTPVHLFGVSNNLTKFFPSDYELAAVEGKRLIEHQPSEEIEVELSDFKDQTVTYKISGRKHKVNLKLSGQHNYLNGAAALALCRHLLPEVSVDVLLQHLSEVALAFGRGEKYRLKNGAEIELVLVKNPASFTQALSSYTAEKTNLMIAINDNVADGRDVSWLWDVNFSPLGGQRVLLTSGKRAADMALRLSYEDIKTESIEPNLSKATKALSQKDGKMVILATYTAMLQLYGFLSKNGEKIS